MGNEIKSLVELKDLLGEKNVERLQERIVDIICSRIENDLEDYDKYIFFPPDYDSFFDECFQTAMKKTKKLLVEKMQDKILNSGMEITSRLKEC